MITKIFIFLFGLWCGHILAGYCYSNFTMKIVDSIEKFFEQKRINKQEKKDEKNFRKQEEKYINILKRRNKNERN